MGKTDFLTACIEKLCEENEGIMEHHEQIPYYIRDIKKMLKKIPERYLKITNRDENGEIVNERS